MGLEKAIRSGKEKRVEYGTKGQPYCKSVDYTCRNHGTCPWCQSNRLHNNRKRQEKLNQEMKEYEQNN